MIFLLLNLDGIKEKFILINFDYLPRITGRRLFLQTFFLASKITKLIFFLAIYFFLAAMLVRPCQRFLSEFFFSLQHKKAL